MKKSVFLKDKFIILAVCSLFSIITYAQGWSPYVRNYDRYDYNASPKNTDIDQRSNRIMYFANEKGLLEFDGLRWSTYTLPIEKPALSLYIDKEDNIYVGSYREFGYFAFKEDNQPEYYSLSSDVHFAQEEKITCINEFNGKIYFQSEHSIYIYDKEAGITTVQYDSDMYNMLNVGGHLMLQTRKDGFCKIYEDLIETRIPAAQLKEHIVVSAIVMNLDQLLIATKSNGLYWYENSTYYPFSKQVNDFFKGKEISKLLYQEGKGYFIATRQHGVFFLNEKEEVLRNVNMEGDLLDNTVNDMYLDKEKNVWVSTDVGISLLYTAKPYRVDKRRNLSIGDVQNMVVWENRLYFATSLGLFHTTIDYNNDYKLGNYIPVLDKTEFVYQVSECNGQIVGCSETEIFVVENSKKRTLLKNEKGTKRIAQFVQKGLVPYLITVTEDGIVLFKQDAVGRWQYFKTITGFSGNYSSMVMDLENQLWVSDYLDVYVVKFDDDFTMVEMVGKYDEQNTLPHSSRYRLSEFDGRVVVLTDDEIYTYVNFKKIMVPYTQLNQVPELAKTYKIIPQEFGNGSYFITPSKLVGIKVEKDSVVINDVFIDEINNGNEVVYSIGKDLFFVSVHNSIYKYERKQEREKVPTEIFFKRITALSSDEEDRLLLDGKSPSVPELSFSMNNIEFELSYPFYGSENVFFTYTVHENTYKVEPKNSNEVHFHRIPSGSYVFKACMVDGSNNILAEKEFSFIVKRSPFKTVTAYTIYTILFLSFLATGTLMFIKYYDKKDQVEKEEKKEERKKERMKKELLERHKDLSALSLRIMKNKELLISLKEEILMQKERLGNAYPQKYVDRLVHRIDEKISSEDKEWHIFRENFNKINNNFYRKLKAAYPALTPHDLRFCTYIYLNMQSKEIAQLMNISSRGVEIARYRLRKKMNLSAEINLTEFLMNI